METRTIDITYSSFIESPQGTNKKNNSDSEKKKALQRNPISIKLKIYDFNTNNIIEIYDSLLARKDIYVLYIYMCVCVCVLYICIYMLYICIYIYIYYIYICIIYIYMYYIYIYIYIYMYYIYTYIIIWL